MVVIGDSGSGKSTFLHYIAGLLSRQSNGWFSRDVHPGLITCEQIEGALFIDGKDVSFLEPQGRPVGLVFQQHSVYQHLSVRENLAFPLRLRGTPRCDIDSEIDKIASYLQIGDFLKDRPSTLSVGQVQRVALGKMLLKAPVLALLDEAFAHIDPLVEEKMAGKLRETIRTQKLGLLGAIMVTHDISQVFKADRILLFCRSRKANDRRSDVIQFFRDGGLSAADSMKQCTHAFAAEWCNLIAKYRSPEGES